MMTKGQEKDLFTVEYFIPHVLRGVSVTDSDRVMFLDNSERGLHTEKVDERKHDGFNALILGKIWRGRFMEIYENGALDSSMPYYVILGGYEGEEPMPRPVVDFMKKELFKGIDADIIEKTYQMILHEKTHQPNTPE